MAGPQDIFLGIAAVLLGLIGLGWLTKQTGAGQGLQELGQGLGGLGAGIQQGVSDVFSPHLTPSFIGTFGLRLPNLGGSWGSWNDVNSTSTGGFNIQQSTSESTPSSQQSGGFYLQQNQGGQVGYLGSQGQVLPPPLPVSSGSSSSGSTYISGTSTTYYPQKKAYT